jgi:hypothetical protein
VKSHGLHDWHFFEDVKAHPDFMDRAFGIPICARLKEAVIVSAVAASCGAKEFRPQSVTGDDIKPIFRLASRPKGVRCRQCQDIVDTYDMPAGTRGDQLKVEGTID